MDKDFLLVIIGGVIGLFSSLVSGIIAYILEDRRLKRQWLREDKLRQEERFQAELTKAHDFTQSAQTTTLNKVLRPNWVGDLLKERRERETIMPAQEIDTEYISRIIEETLREVNERAASTDKDPFIAIPDLKDKSDQKKGGIGGRGGISSDL